MELTREETLKKGEEEGAEALSGYQAGMSLHKRGGNRRTLEPGYYHHHISPSVQREPLVRRSNSTQSNSRKHTRLHMPYPNSEAKTSRRSLDSQRARASRPSSQHHRPMCSTEQLRQARRFSASHSRGMSCPPLDITRIMRSISVSSASSISSSTSSSSLSGGGGRLPPPKLSIRKEQHHHVNNNSLSAGFVSHSNGMAANAGWIHGPKAQSALLVRSPVFLPDTGTKMTRAEGLRRRISVKQRETNTPEINIEDNGPYSPSLSDEAYFSVRGTIHSDSGSDGHHHHQSNSARSSARWSTHSAESPHKRYSYSSAAIADALRTLEAANNSSSTLLSPNFRQHEEPIISERSSTDIPPDTEEGMTITLKAPMSHRSESDQPDNTIDAGSEPEARYYVPRGRADTAVSKSSDYPVSEPPSDRPSLDDGTGGGVPIPAIYLDGTTSLWDQYMAELDSSEMDPNIHLKRQRVSQFVRVPWNVEKTVWFGIAICFDALLYVFAILPARFVRSLFLLFMAVLTEFPVQIEQVCHSTHMHVILHSLSPEWRGRASRLGRQTQSWVAKMTGRAEHNSHSDSGDDGIVLGGTMRRWLSHTQLFDFYRGILIIVTCVVLCRIDAAQMYHSIRAQSSLKLYFIFSAMDIFDRLLSSFGHDVMDALQSTATDPRSRRWKSGIAYFALAQGYMLVHTVVLFYQVITLNVAVNAYSDQLLALLISNQFVEIKSNVFKKWEKEMLFQVVCADMVERFQEIVFLFIIILRNLAELVGSTGFPPLFPTTSSTTTTTTTTTSSTLPPTVQTPVSFDSATPSAFGPLVPTWVSVPLIHRIATPVLMVLGTEILIDWIKHAFITKLNWIRPEIYSHYIDILSRDLACSRTAGSKSKSVTLSATTLNEEEEEEDAECAKSMSARAHKSDEKISSEEEEVNQRNHEWKQQPTSYSSSILTHAVVRMFGWLGSHVFAEGSATTNNNRSSGTNPQLFVEQSSRVARRIGLSPIPMACLIMLMLLQIAHILASSSSISGTTGISSGWSVLDMVGWTAVGLIAYSLVVWTKLSFGNRLVQFAWSRYNAFEQRTADSSSSNLKRFDDATKPVDRDAFLEVGKLISKEASEVEWERKRPKWTLDNIERYSLFKSRVP